MILFGFGSRPGLQRGNTGTMQEMNSSQVPLSTEGEAMKESPAMLSRTPFRQFGRIYSSILALGRLPDVIAAMADEVSQKVVQGSELNAAATRELADQIRGSVPKVIPGPIAPVTATTESVRPALRLLDKFRSDLLHSLAEPLLCIDVGARGGVDSALLVLKERSKLRKRMAVPP
jgi:hypothetical protein